jgi:hypothetical protein
MFSHTGNWDDSNWHYYEYNTTNLDIDDAVNKYMEMLEWVENNIDGHYKHCKWQMTDELIKIKFRHEKDYFYFMLRWS